MSEWISVKDRLPKIGQMVLIYNAAQYPFHVSIFERWESDSDLPKVFYACGDEDAGEYCDVTHWMPLPESPMSNIAKAATELCKSFKDDVEKVFNKVKKDMRESIKTEMPDLRTGMTIKLKEDDNLYMVTSVSFLNNRVSVVNLEDENVENDIHFDKIEAIYKYICRGIGIDMSGKEIKRSLTFKKIWERPKTREISRQIAELMLTEKLNEPVKIVE